MNRQNKSTMESERLGCDSMGKQRQYIAIDLKSFYASVECVDRKLNPLQTNLVVADSSRTEKTICLAVSPSLKAYGISGRARLFEVVQRVKEVNEQRSRQLLSKTFIGKSNQESELEKHLDWEVDYIIAPPRMARYIEVSTQIYQIYLKYIAPEDIHVYSIDEVFMDVTDYLGIYKMTARELATQIVSAVFDATHITATVGIGTNLYLSKVAMDIVAKNISAKNDGAKIAELDEMRYRKLLWTHEPITDFWRVGKGYARKLQEQGIYTMGDIARCSIGGKEDYYNEDLLYRLFGVNAELLIDHAWGWEPCTMKEIKTYKPISNSLGTGQVLQYPYEYDKAKLIVREMTDLLVLDLVEKRLVTDQIVLTIGYDRENINDNLQKRKYKGTVVTDQYGRKIPKPAHGSIQIGQYTSSTKLIMKKTMELFEQIVDCNLLVRKIQITANHLVKELEIKNTTYEQRSLFVDYDAIERDEIAKAAELEKERKLQEAMLDIKKKYGKNAILKANNLQKGAMTIERNKQIGGHKA